MDTTYASQIVRTTSPLNTEPQPDQLAREFVTPIEQFYIRNHGTIPEIDPSRYRLSVGGAVTKPLTLTLEDIKSKFDRVSVMATLQCAGNRRSELATIRPVPGEVPWAAQAIGNAEWAGARLRDVLETAGLQREAQHVAFLGLDEIEKEGKQISFGASIPASKALEPETILAYEMNGRPLTAIHGYPLRTVVPGFIGARSVKWLGTITAQHEPSTNFYQARSYRVFPPNVDAATVNWERGIALEEIAINSVVCSPSLRETITSGMHRFHGYAVGCGGARVERVDISIDGGKTWKAADVTHNQRQWTWCHWDAQMHVPTGSHRFVVRAQDADGHVQPQDGRPIWNFKGYGYNAWQVLEIDAL